MHLQITVLTLLLSLAFGSAIPQDNCALSISYAIDNVSKSYWTSPIRAAAAICTVNSVAGCSIAAGISHATSVSYTASIDLAGMSDIIGASLAAGFSVSWGSEDASSTSTEIQCPPYRGLSCGIQVKSEMQTTTGLVTKTWGSSCPIDDTTEPFKIDAPVVFKNLPANMGASQNFEACLALCEGQSCDDAVYSGMPNCPAP